MKDPRRWEIYGRSRTKTPHDEDIRDHCLDALLPYFEREAIAQCCFSLPRCISRIRACVML